MVGFVLMCILYACYAADVVVTAFAASDLARELDALERWPTVCTPCPMP